MEHIRISLNGKEYEVPKEVADNIELLYNSYAKILSVTKNLRYYQKIYFSKGQKRHDWVNVQIYERQVDSLLAAAQVSTPDNEQKTLFENGQQEKG